MLVTQRTPSILSTLLSVYKDSNINGKAYTMASAAIYHNNSPINILVAITSLKDVDCMIRLGRCHPVEFEYCLRYFAETTGYSAIELMDRFNIK